MNEPELNPSTGSRHVFYFVVEGKRTDQIFEWTESGWRVPSREGEGTSLGVLFRLGWVYDKPEEEAVEPVPNLLPCPFCAKGTTQILPEKGVWTGKGYSEPISVSVNHWCEPVPGQPSRMIERVGRDEKSAIEAWNMRAVKVNQEGVAPHPLGPT